MPASFTHGFAFDPSYDYSLDELLNVGAPLAQGICVVTGGCIIGGAWQHCICNCTLRRSMFHDFRE